MSYTETDVDRLGERLDAIDLAEGERAALEALMAFAARKPSELSGLGNLDSAERYQQVLNEILFD